MPVEIIVDVIPPGGGKVAVTHIFRGETEDEARDVFEAHVAGCAAFTKAVEEDRTAEEVEHISDGEWPEYDLDGDEEETDGEPEDDEPEE